jgi:hypothetical protein
MCSHDPLLLRHDLLHGRASQEPLVPGVVVWVALRDIELAGLVAHDEGDHHVPGDEAEVGNGALAAHEVLLALQLAVQHVQHAPDLLKVALRGARDALRVEAREPRRLSVVWSLACTTETSVCARSAIFFFYFCFSIIFFCPFLLHRQLNLILCGALMRQYEVLNTYLTSGSEAIA